MRASYDLQGRKALVTGGASGIGLGAVEAFLRCGASVAINDLPGSPNLAEQVERLRAAGHDVIAAPGEGWARGRTPEPLVIEGSQLTVEDIEALDMGFTIEDEED